MHNFPPEPSPGDEIGATLIRDLIRACRANVLLQSAGILVSRGPNGTTIKIRSSAGNSAAAEVKGRFHAKVTFNESSRKSSVEFENCYYDIGGKTYELSDETTVGNVESGNIVALKITATGSRQQSATLVRHSNLQDLQEAQRDLDFYEFPLYMFGAGGKITCDFRVGPLTAMGEFEQ